MRRLVRHSLALFVITSALPAQTVWPDSPASLELRRLAGARMDVAALLLAGREGGPLWTAALAVPDESGADYWIEIDGSSLLDGLEEDSVRLELHAYAMNAEGELAASSSRWTRVTLANHQDVLGRGGVKLADRFELPPGRYQLRILAVEPASQRFALRFVDVEVPVSGQGTDLAPPLFDEVADAWVVARSSSEGREASALPVLSVHRQESLRIAAAQQIKARLLEVPPQGQASDAASVAEIALETEESESELLEVRFQIPENVGTGSYLLEITAKRPPRQIEMPVFVLGNDWQGDDDRMTWPAVRNLTLDPESQRRALELTEQRRSSQRVAAIATAYREVLDLLAAGNNARAVDSLVDLETEVMASSDNQTRARGWLSNAQDEVIEELTATDPESLVPLLGLHLGSYERHAIDAARNAMLLGAARQRILDLARLYAASGAADFAPPLAASVLAELGTRADRAGLPMAAQRMLEEALVLDDANATMLLYLAHWHERRSAPDAAVPLLRRLVQVASDSRQGRLRLAICLRQLGENQEATQQLREIITHPKTDWILAIAYQELARLLLLGERPDEAAELLSTAVKRMPDEQRLHVQLAYALERAGRKREGQDVLAALPADSGRLSPRNLYSRRPDSGGAGALANLERHATARLPLLSRALTRSETSR